MADGTAIEWTHRPGTKGESWNPIRARNKATGKIGWHCVHASEGCRFCYAERVNKGFFNLGTGLPYKPGHEAEIDIFLDEQVLMQPLRWKSPRTIFVCSMTDAFGDFVGDFMLDRMFAVVALCPQHVFIWLTKRAKRQREYLAASSRPNQINGAIWSLLGTPRGSRIEHSGKWRCTLPMPNCWHGVSAEDQANADERVSELLATPAAIRFVSAEPLLGPIDFENLYHGDTLTDALDGMSEQGVVDAGDRYVAIDPTYREHSKLDWIIVGGESGPHARPMHPDWARSIRDQCQTGGVPFFFKQWGEHRPLTAAEHGQACGATLVGSDPHDRDAYLLRVGKKRAGRFLDRVEHNAFPEFPHA